MQAKRFEKVSISNIKVGDRFRKDMGDIEGLAQSIKEHGLLQAILLNSNYELIAGARRLEACKKLAWTEIDAFIADIKNIVDGEIEENAVRKAFNVSEMVAIYQQRSAEEKESARERMMAGKPVSESDRGRVRDKIARIFGIAGIRCTRQKI